MIGAKCVPTSSRAAATLAKRFRKTCRSLETPVILLQSGGSAGAFGMVAAILEHATPS